MNQKVDLIKRFVNNQSPEKQTERGKEKTLVSPPEYFSFASDECFFILLPYLQLHLTLFFSDIVGVDVEFLLLSEIVFLILLYFSY